MSELTHININELLDERHPSVRMPEHLKDGENVVAEKNGIKLVAFGFEGRVVDWIGYDTEGHEVPVVVTRKPSPEGKGLKAAARLYQVCVCLSGPEITCWWVECICGRCASVT